MEFRVLGPTEIYTSSGGSLALRQPRQCAILCILLLNPGARLTRSHLIEAVWGFDPPGDPGGALRSYIYNLRKVPGIGHRLRTHASGYAIHLLDDDVLDVLQFYELTRKAAEASRRFDHATSARLLEGAVAIWRDPPLADLPPTPAMQPIAAELLERRNMAEDELADARLAAGNHRELLPTLKSLTAAEPLRECRWQQLMIALYRSGRQAEALDAYSGAHAALKECGLSPGPGLERLQQRVLSNDPALDFRSTSAASFASSEQRYISVMAIPTSTPHQLPNSVRDFIGRNSELVALSALAHNAQWNRYSATVVVVAGPPGVGKSALATHAAHQLAELFPDGQLYLDLKGFAPREHAVPPADALGSILESLGQPHERIPSSLEARAALYRTVLTHRRTLLVLDDAVNTAQVQHLVPASPGCMVIITCRRLLTNLVASNGAHLISLDLMSAEEATALLASRLSPPRSTAEKDAVAQLAELCAHLPLALATVAALASEQPELSLSGLASSVRRSSRRLDYLCSLEPECDVRSSFDVSYVRLSSMAARVLRLTTLVPGPEMTVQAVAKIAAITLAEATMALRELRQMHLITERSPGRFTLHDLMRAYSAERLEAEGPD